MGDSLPPTHRENGSQAQTSDRQPLVYGLRDNRNLSVSVRVGVTRDMPDVYLPVHVPATF